MGTEVRFNASNSNGKTLLDDLQVIDATLSGDREAFGSLVVKYQDRLFNAMAHTTGSREEAEDVVQDAFVQAFTNLNRFQKRSLFYTWLYRIALNVRASRARRKRPATLGETATKLAKQRPDQSPGAVEQAISSECIEQLHAALGQLSDQFREILVLRELEGRNYEEIADILEIQMGTVRSRLHRARIQLQAIFEAQHAEATPPKTT